MLNAAKIFSNKSEARPATADDRLARLEKERATVASELERVASELLAAHGADDGALVERLRSEREALWRQQSALDHDIREAAKHAQLAGRVEDRHQLETEVRDLERRYGEWSANAEPALRAAAAHFNELEALHADQLALSNRLHRFSERGGEAIAQPDIETAVRAPGSFMGAFRTCLSAVERLDSYRRWLNGYRTVSERQKAEERTIPPTVRDYGVGAVGDGKNDHLDLSDFGTPVRSRWFERS